MSHFPLLVDGLLVKSDFPTVWFDYNLFDFTCYVVLVDRITTLFPFSISCLSQNVRNFGTISAGVGLHFPCKQGEAA